MEYNEIFFETRQSSQTKTGLVEVIPKGREYPLCMGSTAWPAAFSLPGFSGWWEAGI